MTDTNPERSRCIAVKIIGHTPFLRPRRGRVMPLQDDATLCAQSSITPLRCSYRPRSKLWKPFRQASHATLSPVVKAPQSGISPCKCRGISFSSPYGARTRRFICRLTASNPAAQAAAEPHRSDPPYRLQPYTLSGSFFTSVLPYDLPGCHAPGCLRARPIRYTRGLGPYAAQPAAAPLMHISPPYPRFRGHGKGLLNAVM